MKGIKVLAYEKSHQLQLLQRPEERQSQTDQKLFFDEFKRVTKKSAKKLKTQKIPNNRKKCTEDLKRKKNRSVAKMKIYCLAIAVPCLLPSNTRFGIDQIHLSHLTLKKC